MERELELVLDWSLFGLSGIGSILNIVVLLFARLFIRKRDEKAAHLAIASITTANLLLTLIHHPLRILGKEVGLFTSAWECLGVYGVVWVGIPASAFSLTLLNLDKLLYFACPLRYDYLVTFWRAVGAVLVAWLLCVGNVVWGLADGSIFFNQEKASELQMSGMNGSSEAAFICNAIQIYVPWYALYAGLFTVTPVLSSLCLSIYILILSQRFRRSVGSITSQSMSRSVGAKCRSTLFIFITTVWTTLALVPARLYFLANHTPHLSIELLMTYLLYLDPIVNPVITLAVNPMYLKALRDWLSKLRNRIIKPQLQSLSRRGESVTVMTSVNRSQNSSGDSKSEDFRRKTSKTLSTDSDILLPTIRPTFETDL